MRHSCAAGIKAIGSYKQEEMGNCLRVGPPPPLLNITMQDMMIYRASLKFVYEQCEYGSHLACDLTKLKAAYYTFVKSQLSNVVDPSYIVQYLTHNHLLYNHMFWMNIQLHLWTGNDVVYGVIVRR